MSGAYEGRQFVGMDLHRRRSVLVALPASRIGKTGSTQGEIAVMTPARKAIARRTSTREA